jgi:apyrase
VISGAEEGIFGWVAINYLTRTLGEDSTYGALGNCSVNLLWNLKNHLEMGGASNQITLATSENLAENSYSLSFNNQTYNIYAYSYLSYGQDEFLQTVLRHLTSQLNQSETEFENPCYLEGYTESFTYNGSALTVNGTGNADEVSLFL